MLAVRRADDPTAIDYLRGAEIARVVLLKTSPCRGQVALTNVRNELVLVDLETRSMRVLDRSPHPPLINFNFSPDGRFIAYNWRPNRRTALIRICRIDDGATFNVTRPVLADFAPVFDPDGAYLFFIGAREFNPVYDKLHFNLGFPKGTRPYLVSLRKDVATPFGRKFELPPKDAQTGDPTP